MGILKVAGKFLDQPILVAKFKKTVPYLLTTGGVIYTANSVRKAEEQERKDIAIKTTVTLGATIASALFAPKIVNKMFKVSTKNMEEIKQTNKFLVDNFVQKNNVEPELKTILEKSHWQNKFNSI